jgi:hypothetical protein
MFCRASLEETANTCLMLEDTLRGGLELYCLWCQPLEFAGASAF